MAKSADITHRAEIPAVPQILSPHIIVNGAIIYYHRRNIGDCAYKLGRKPCVYSAQNAVVAG